ncbi:MAG: hypothetical protein H0A76_02155 [Candidatus Thiodubiliella endoseptemdiera]|uniref:Uncharacterized protein n=1 Tax=Candidatus Thiodubiliella endoseptemdiera TaxID=2738886 RepID=A0A853EZH2_9GAMM|nr:hypothetical protein [Candidatus Thiodubiliella endoseptemdiera]
MIVNKADFEIPTSAIPYRGKPAGNMFQQDFPFKLAGLMVLSNYWGTLHKLGDILNAIEDKKGTKRPQLV